MTLDASSGLSPALSSTPLLYLSSENTLLSEHFPERLDKSFKRGERKKDAEFESIHHCKILHMLIIILIIIIVIKMESQV